MESKQSMSVSEFASTQLLLLKKELDAEKQETALLFTHASPAALQRAGLAITNLAVTSQRTGFGGKTVIELGKDAAYCDASEGIGQQHGIRTGDIVRTSRQPSGSAKKKTNDELAREGVDGVVTRVQDSAIHVALSQDDADVPEGRVWLVKLANEATYRRMEETMKKLRDVPEDNETSLMRVCFGHTSPTPVDLSTSDNVKTDLVDASLDDSQREAVRFALASTEVALIHGPPGTGKTHTLVELILQLLRRGKRVLVCGPSNVSVDNIVERLAPHKVAMIRLGHPARLLPSVVEHSLDVLTRTSDAAAIVRDVRHEMDEKQKSVRKTRNGRERRAIYADLKDLRREYRQREDKCVDELVRHSNVVLATLHGAGGYQIRGQHFDVVIIDEASQALEAQCWIPLLTATKVVLAGDHLQLPPTVKSEPFGGKGKKTKGKKEKSIAREDTVQSQQVRLTLGTTLFDRLLHMYGPSIKRMLTTQYRMHETIMRFPSDTLYESKLVAADSVKTRLLRDLSYDVEATDETTEPIVFYDTQGGLFAEMAQEDDPKSHKTSSIMLTESKCNMREAALVKQHVQQLVDAGVVEEDIGVITPYNAQLAYLSQTLKPAFPHLELSSIDGFQGREKEAIIISLVRSNDDHEVGFLHDRRRLNVAMTRPRRHLCVIGDSETVRRGNGFLNSWMSFLEEKADLRFAADYVDD